MLTETASPISHKHHERLKSLAACNKRIEHHFILFHRLASAIVVNADLWIKQYLDESSWRKIMTKWNGGVKTIGVTKCLANQKVPFCHVISSAQIITLRIWPMPVTNVLKELKDSLGHTTTLLVGDCESLPAIAHTGCGWLGVRVHKWTESRCLRDAGLWSAQRNNKNSWSKMKTEMVRSRSVT